MNKIAFAMVGAAALALAGCGSKTDDTVNDQQTYNDAADNLESIANNSASQAESDALQNQADQLRTEGDSKAPANDTANAADTNQADADAPVNGM